MIPASSRRFAGVLFRWRWSLLALAVVLAAVAVWPANRVAFDQSIESMFAPDDPLLAPYLKLKRTFGGNEIVLAVYDDPELLDPGRRGIQRLAEISRRCERVPGVRAVLSLDRPLGERIVEPNAEASLRMRRLFEQYTHGSDGRTVAISCMLESDSAAPVPRRQTVDGLRKIMQELPDGLSPGVIAGEPVMVVDGFRYLQEDGKRLGIWSTICLSATIWICFRSLRWVVIPVAVVQFTLVLTKALMVWVDLRLTFVSSMLTALVTVIGIATIVHVIVRYRVACSAGRSHRAALLWAGAWCAAPVFWICGTNAMGFGSLLLAQVGPVQNFGLMMALGSMLVPASAALLLPGLASWGNPPADPRPLGGERKLGWLLQRILEGVQRWPRTVSCLAAISVGIAVTGVWRLDVETDFTKNFRAGSPVVRSYSWVEDRLGGAGVWDVIVPAPARLDWAYLCRVQALEQRLRTEAGGSGSGSSARLTKVLSLADAVIESAPVNLAQLPLDELRTWSIEGSLRVMRSRMPEFVAALYAEDRDQPGQHRLRIMLRARERLPAADKRALIEHVNRIAREEFPPAAGDPGAEVTGFFVLLTSLIESVLRDEWLTFAAATAGITLIMLIAFRSPVLALIALVPNGFPVLMTMGLMGWLAVPVNLGAAMISAVSLGLSVDSSIHYIVAYLRARRAGRGAGEALDEVQQIVGRAMVLSTLALIVGFSVLCTSQFVPTVYFGALVSLAMLGGLLGNLLVLPLLLRLVIPVEKRVP